MKPRAIAACLSLACAVAAAPARAEVERIVVLPISAAKGIDEKTSQLLDEVLLAELSQIVPSSIEIFGASDAAAMIGAEQQRQLMGCDDTSCLVEIGAAMGASHLLASTLGQLGEQYVVSTKLINVHEAKVRFRKILYVKADEAALLQGVRDIVKEMGQEMSWSAPIAPETGSATAPAEAAAASSASGGGGPLFWAGVAGTGGGAALAAVGGGLALTLDQMWVGDKSLWWEDRQPGIPWVIGLGATGAAGGLVMLAGGALLLTSWLTADPGGAP